MLGLTTSLFRETKEVAQFLCGWRKVGEREGLRLKGKEVEEMGIRTATPRRDWEGNDDAMGFSLILAWDSLGIPVAVANSIRAEL